MMTMTEIERLLRAGDVSMEAVAARLKLVRAAFDISQKAMADIMGTSVSNYQEVEYARQYPRPHHVQALMVARGIDHNFVFAGSARAAPPEIVLHLSRPDTNDALH